MRALALCLAIGMVMGVPAPAETVKVQTGEHPGFTRLVLQLARPTAWAVGRTGTGYGLRLGRADVALDLTRSFDRIPRTRIASMTTNFSGTALQVTVGCVCHVQAFEQGPGIVVIDVLDGPPQPLSRFETALAPRIGVPAPTRAAAFRLTSSAALPVPETRQLSQLPQFWQVAEQRGVTVPGILARALVTLRDGAPARPTSQEIAAASDVLPAPGPIPVPAPVPLSLPTLAEAHRAETATEQPQAMATPALDADPTFQLRPARSRIGDARTILLQELSRAASQGLVDVVQPVRPMLASEPAPEPAPVEVLPGSQPVAEANDHVTIKAETSIDRDALHYPDGGSVTQDGVACLPDDSFALSDWGDATPPAEQIANRRQTLIGEFDRAVPEAVAAMAQLYLYLGFGAEARGTIAAFGVEVPDRDLIEAMAVIMDGGNPGRGRLKAMADCDSAAAMWAVLATPQLAPGELVDTMAVIRTFSALPVHLRRLLGPMISNRFLAIGDEATARTIQGAVTRAAGDIGPEARLVDAKLELSRDNPDVARTELADVVAEDGSASPDALILLIETQIAQGMTVDAANVETAAAMAFEHRGTAMGSQLARIQVLAAAASGDFDRAFATLAVQTKAGPEAMPTELDEDLFNLLQSKAADATFLRHMFGATDRLVAADLSRGLRQALATRMVALGFPDQARSVLAAGPAPKAADRLLLAKIALANRDPGAALRLVEGMESPAATRLRAQALAAFGYHAGAAGAFAAAGESAEAASSGWRAGDLATVQALGSPAQQAAVAALLTPVIVAASPEPGATVASGGADAVPGAAPLPEGPLARNRALLAESEATRASLAKLLEAFPAPTTPATP